MQGEVLREPIAGGPLSLGEEYAMQGMSWIVLAVVTFNCWSLQSMVVDIDCLYVYMEKRLLESAE